MRYVAFTTSFCQTDLFDEMEELASGVGSRSKVELGDVHEANYSPANCWAMNYVVYLSYFNFNCSVRYPCHELSLSVYKDMDIDSGGLP